MTEIAFYHLQRSTLEQALPRLLEKTLAAGKRAVVVLGTPERVEALNAALWSFDQDSWIPHGSAADGNAADQPVWLTATDENPNGARYLFLASRLKCWWTFS
jgi:DNA polymerase-3 subunit chi